MGSEQSDRYDRLMESPEDRVDYDRQPPEEGIPKDRSRWLLLIKEMRAAHSCGIYEAECRALQQPAWKRWVARQINHDAECAKMARSHIRYNGDKALIAEDNGKLIVRNGVGSK
ncbi:hypothetical protein M2333_003215 [Sphingobium sp. B11D3B]|nr:MULTISPECIES: hypothetical protein [unclassified Sphingobium]MCW2390169.1 hypothetical protein [Sphingobium sp. B11D3B]